MFRWIDTIDGFPKPERDVEGNRFWSVDEFVNIAAVLNEKQSRKAVYTMDRLLEEAEQEIVTIISRRLMCCGVDD